MPRVPLGRPQRDVNITTTLSDDEYAQLLAWIDKQSDPKSLRSEAVRRFVLGGLGILEKMTTGSIEKVGKVANATPKASGEKNGRT